MTKRGTMRHGSLQFWPRKKARKILPRVSWNSLLNNKNKGLLGFIGYKVGMASAYVRDNTQHSLTKGQRIIIPVTIIEIPTIKIFSVRFYNNNNLIGEVLNHNLDKELKKKLKIPDDNKGKKSDAENKKNIEDFNDYDNIKLIIYSQVKKTNIKKKPDIVEIGMSGSLDDKLNFVKENLSKEISIYQFLNEEYMKDGLVDFRGVTKGKGFQGATKRFGLRLQFHKSEKGVRGPGSGGAWHPARVEFRQPMAGQLGFFTRVINNSKIIEIANIKDRDINSDNGFKNFGKIKNDYIIVSGSVQGPSKRPLLITTPLRPTKNQLKKNYEFLELR